MIQLDKINAAERDAFVALLGGVFEHSPWVAARTWGARPFTSTQAVHTAMMNAVRAATPAEQLALVRAHPELAGREASEGELTVDSSGEQGRLGFTALSADEFKHIGQLNRAYRERFGFPCIVALCLHQVRATVLSDIARRLSNTADAELAIALAQIGHITQARLAKLMAVEQPMTSGKLTTHVLDTTHGQAAAGMKIEFSVLQGSQWQLLKSLHTNADGRTDTPLLAPGELRVGQYQLIFYVAEYFRSNGTALPDPPFIDKVPLVFGIANADAHYHVPLLCSPWSYSTYRGS